MVWTNIWQWAEYTVSHTTPAIADFGESGSYFIEKHVFWFSLWYLPSHMWFTVSWKRPEAAAPSADSAWSSSRRSAGVHSWLANLHFLCCLIFDLWFTLCFSSEPCAMFVHTVTVKGTKCSCMNDCFNTKWNFQDSVALSFMLFENLGLVLNPVVPLYHYLKHKLLTSM